jgi:uncharacterized protein YecE (DUF72 family)
VVFPTTKPRTFHGLEYLAERLDLVEISASFTEALRPELARLWLRKTARNSLFRFTSQLGRRFTHDRDLDPVAVREFRDGLNPLYDNGKLGCLLMRFPWSFRFTRENREFLIELRRTFHPFPLAAELRHSSWTMDEALGTLMDYQVGFCNVDQPAGARALAPSAIITSPIGYVRLLGRAGDDWTQEEAAADYLYSPVELGQWQHRIERLAAHTAAVYVVAANSPGGKSVINAMQLRATLSSEASQPARRASDRTAGAATRWLPVAS